MNPRSILTTTIATLLIISSARAATKTWNDPDADNTWDTTATSNWVDGIAWNNTAPDSAIFGGTGETINLGAAIIANNLTFNVDGYSITGSGANNLTFGGITPTITVTNAGQTATITAPLAGDAVGKEFDHAGEEDDMQY